MDLHWFLAVTLVAFLIVGGGMSIFGYQEYRTLTQTTYPTPATKFGIVVFSSPWTRIDTNGQVEVRIYDIRIDANTARLNVVCTFDTNDETTNKLLFGIQLPYNFSAPIVDVKMQSRSTGHGQGGGRGNLFFLTQSAGIDQKNGLFYFWVIVDRHDFLLSLYDNFSFNVTMNLKEPLYRKSYTAFELINQFDSAFPTVPPSGLPREIAGATFSYFSPTSSESYALEVAQPEHSRVESTPAADAIVYSGRRTWYLWNLLEKRSGLDFFGMAILTDFDMLDLVDHRETMIFRDGLFLGVGIPTAMTSAVELLRELKRRTTQNGSGSRKEKQREEEKGR